MSISLVINTIFSNFRWHCAHTRLHVSSCLLLFADFKKVIHKNFEMWQAVFCCLCVTHRNSDLQRKAAERQRELLVLVLPFITVHNNTVVTIPDTGRYKDTWCLSVPNTLHTVSPLLKQDWLKLLRVSIDHHYEIIRKTCTFSAGEKICTDF